MVFNLFPGQLQLMHHGVIKDNHPIFSYGAVPRFRIERYGNFSRYDNVKVALKRHRDLNGHGDAPVRYCKNDSIASAIVHNIFRKTAAGIRSTAV
jgi:hypothetical protein